MIPTQELRYKTLLLKGPEPGPIIPSPVEVEDQWLTTTQAARLIGVHPITLKRQSRIPYVKHGRMGWRRYRRSDVEQYLIDGSVFPVE